MAKGVAQRLAVELAAPHPILWRAARALDRAWSTIGGGHLRLLRRSSRHGGPRIRLGLGSLLRPSVVVAFDAPFEPEPAAAAERLALTIAAWDSLAGLEPWRALSAPLPDVARIGRPDRGASWVVVHGGASASAAPLLESGAQLHVIGGLTPAPAGAVWWPSWPSVVAAVLGRADAVVGDADPLVFDGIRAGVATRPLGDGTAWRKGALAGLVPPSLLGDERLWLHVAETARVLPESSSAPAPLMTRRWLARGRERIRQHQAAPPSSWERLRRRHDKLRRDPARFFADSRFGILRRLGRRTWGR